MIDSNDTRWRLFLSVRDWRAHLPSAPGSASRSVAWNAGAQALSLEPEQFQFPTPEGAEPIGLARRRGAAVDQFQNRYWINDDENGLVFRGSNWQSAVDWWPVSGSQRCESPGDTDFAPQEPTLPADLRLRGLAVTAAHYLVVGVLSPEPGLLIFDLHGGGPPTRIVWGESTDGSVFQPWDIAPRPGGGVWILDLAAPGDDPHAVSNVPRLWVLDEYFRVEGTTFESDPPDFEPAEGGGAKGRSTRAASGAVELTEGALLQAAPIAIESAGDDTALLMWTSLATGGVFISRMGRESHFGRVQFPSPTEVTFDGEPWRGHDFTFRMSASPPPGELTGVLFVIGQDGNQAYGYGLRANETLIELSLMLEYYPLRRFSGKALVAVPPTADVTHPHTGVYYDMADRWVKLAAYPRPRYATSGVLELDADQPLDGDVLGCVWHRVFLDAHVPPGARISIESRASDRREDLTAQQWNTEPAPYFKHTGSEVPYVLSDVGACEGRPRAGTWEVLFQRACGRYLQLRVRLFGPGRATPRIYAMRVHYPRFSYLEHYLPAVYRADPTSADFLERFLCNAEGMFTELEGRIAEVQTLFDDRTVAEEFLDWLASWLGVTLDPTWTESKRRLFLANAHRMFRERGTLRGLARAIRLAISPCANEALFEPGAVAADVGDLGPGAAAADPFGVRLIESFLTRSMPGIIFGDPDAPMTPTFGDDDWSPDDGAEELHSRWRAFLASRYDSDSALREAWESNSASLASARLSPVVPADPEVAADWREFMVGPIGFTYVEPLKADEALWRSLLLSRYGTVQSLNEAHQRSHSSFGAVGFPSENAFPAGGPALADWIQFVSVVLPLHRRAHHFTVLVPTNIGDTETEERERLELVRRIVEIEKPAHTSFDVRPYWAAFRVGSARLGYDTLIDQGGRYAAVILGTTYLALGHVGHAHPFDVVDRHVVGREQVG